MSKDDFERLKEDFNEDRHITFDEFIILKEHECKELITMIKLKSDKAKIRKLWQQYNCNSRFQSSYKSSGSNSSNDRYNDNNDDNNNNDNNNNDEHFNEGNALYI